jgi:hypothetical protein
MKEYNIDKYNFIINKNYLLEKNLEKIIYNPYFFPFIKNYLDENNNVIEEYEDFFDNFTEIIYKIICIYILLLSQVYIFLENNEYRKNDENYIITIYLMYCDFYSKNKLTFNLNNISILYQTYLYFEKYKYSNNNFYLLYKRFNSIYKMIIDSNIKKININEFFRKNIINDYYFYELESFLI